MNEFSAALRQFADHIDAGKLLPGANQCAIVLANEDAVQATYIGKLAPGDKAGINLLAAGIAKFNTGESATTPVADSAQAAAAGGSIFGAGR